MKLLYRIYLNVWGTTLSNNPDLYTEKLRSIEDIAIKDSVNICDLLELYSKAHGFMASHLVEAYRIIVDMVRECDLRILTFTANIVATGYRGLLAQILKSKKIDIVITTCGAIDHDLARSFGGQYLRGSFDVDDRELHRHGIHRLGNVFIPMESYGPLIEKVTFRILDRILKETQRKVWSVYELLKAMGRYIDDRNSILRAAYESNTEIFVPGIVDGAFGMALFIYSQFQGFELNLFNDMKRLADRVFSASRLGAIVIGGGISKHHAIWWAQLREGLDYAVYVTTANEWDGSLSGARPKEAISWGKLKERARYVVLYTDATLVLPILAHAIIYGSCTEKLRD